MIAGGSRIPQIKLKPALKTDSRRTSSMSDADAVHRSDMGKAEPTRVSPPGSPRLSRSANTPKRTTSSSKQGKVRQGSEEGSPPRPKREITLPLSPSQGRKTATVHPSPPLAPAAAPTSGAKQKETYKLQSAGIPSELVKNTSAQPAISQPSTSRQSSEAPVTYPEDESICDPLMSLLSKNKLSGSISKNSIVESNM